MKKLLILAVLAFTVFSCEENETTPIKQENILSDDFSVDLKGMNFDRGVTLADLNNQDMIKQSIQELIKDAEAIKEANPEAEYVNFYLETVDGQLLVTGYNLVSKKQKVLKAEYSPKARSGGPAPPALIAAFCPGNYEQLALCSNFQNTDTCVGEAVTSYIFSNTSAVGNCLDIRISVGGFNTRVCGKKC